jgi:Tol biopolymer transport system component
MKRSGTLLAVLATLLVAFLAATQPASAIVPGANGRIVFSRLTCHRECLYSLITATPSDANEHVLIGPIPQSDFDEHLIGNWSPDGKHVIFMMRNGIWGVRPNGTDLHEIFHAPKGTGLDDGPTFTPDGKHIVFTRCCHTGHGYSLWMLDTDGTSLTDITTEPFVNGDGPGDTSPQVSPTDRRIAFNRCFPDAPCQIATVRMDGTHLRMLTHGTAFASEHAGWSPDGTQIVYHRNYLNGGGSDIVVMNADGSDKRRLTFYGPAARDGSFAASFSPSGGEILFAHFPSTGGTDLYTMSRDGGYVTQVTRTLRIELESQWAAT